MSFNGYLNCKFRIKSFLLCSQRTIGNHRIPTDWKLRQCSGEVRGRDPKTRVLGSNPLFLYASVS